MKQSNSMLLTAFFCFDFELLRITLNYLKTRAPMGNIMQYQGDYDKQKQERQAKQKNSQENKSTRVSQAPRHNTTERDE